MSKIRQDHKASVTIQFATPAAAVQWFRAAVEHGILQEEAGLFQMDALDEGQITSANEFIVRRAGTRGDQQVRIRSTDTVEVEG
jgi:hypothetical protein